MVLSGEVAEAMRRQRSKNPVSLHHPLRSGVSVGRERKSPGGREKAGDVRRKGWKEAGRK